MPHPSIVQLEHATFRGPLGPVFPASNLEIQAGQRWAIVGPGGSGKGLLLEGLMGRLPLLAGRLRHPFLEGDPRFPDTVYGVLPPGSIALASMAQHREWLIDRDFHQLRWHASLTAGRATVGACLERNVVEGRHPFAVLDEAGAERFAASHAREIERFHLDGLLDRPLPALSNGELHRLLLARALMLDPLLLCVDEPFAGLDDGHRRDFLRALDTLSAEGIAVILATSRPDDLPMGITHVAEVENHCLLRAGARRPRAIAPPREAEPIFLPPMPTSPLPPGEPLLDLRDVTVRTFGATLLNHVNWRVQPGEQWILLGKNGSGKSTLLSLILADHPQVHANHVAVAGKQPGPGYSIWDRKALLGWVAPELDAHYPAHATVLEVVLSGFDGWLGTHRDADPGEEQRALDLLGHLGLSPCRHACFGGLSTLDRRLALLARATVHRPPLLLLDEPCQGLDETGRAHFLAAVAAVVAALSAGLVFVTHDPVEIPVGADRLLVLDQGRVRYQGPLAGYAPDYLR